MLANRLLVVAFAACFLFSGCRADALRAPTSSPSATLIGGQQWDKADPTPQTSISLPTAPTGFTDGVLAVPEGYTLFIEFSTYLKGSGDCGLAAYDSFYDPYRYGNGHLQVGTLERTWAPDVYPKLLLGTSTEIVGEAGFGGWSEVAPVDRLPYSFSHTPDLVLQEVAGDGSFVLAVDGRPYRVQAGKSWWGTFEGQGDRVEWPEKPGCRATRTLWLHNRRLLRQEDIEFGTP